MEKKNKLRLFLTVLAGSLLCILLGRLSTQFASTAATDVAFPEWVAFVMSLLSQLIVAARLVLGYAGMTACAYTAHPGQNGRKITHLPRMLTLVLAMSFADYLARFLIDFISGSITGTEIVAVIWLLLQFFYEAVFIVLSMIIIMLLAGRHSYANTVRGRERTSPAAAVRYSVLLTLLAHIALEIVSIIEFVTTYTDITSAETASMIGSVVRILVIYGGGSLLLGELFADLLLKKPGENA